MKDAKLQIYLNDHLAGAIGGSELAKRAQRNNAGTPVGEFLLEFMEEVEEDKAALKQFIALAGCRENPLKKTGAWVTEKAGRLKLNGELRKYSDLSRLEELEGLLLGVRGKLGMWLVLEDVYGKDNRFKEVGFRPLINRARRQQKRMEDLRMAAAQEVFRKAA